MLTRIGKCWKRRLHKAEGTEKKLATNTVRCIIILLRCCTECIRRLLRLRGFALFLDSHNPSHSNSPFVIYAPHPSTGSVNPCTINRQQSVDIERIRRPILELLDMHEWVVEVDSLKKHHRSQGTVNKSFCKPEFSSSNSTTMSSNLTWITFDPRSIVFVEVDVVGVEHERGEAEEGNWAGLVLEREVDRVRNIGHFAKTC